VWANTNMDTTKVLLLLHHHLCLFLPHFRQFLSFLPPYDDTRCPPFHSCSPAAFHWATEFCCRLILWIWKLAFQQIYIWPKYHISFLEQYLVPQYALCQRRMPNLNNITYDVRCQISRKKRWTDSKRINNRDAMQWKRTKTPTTSVT
jgi:hypothetical protein